MPETTTLAAEQQTLRIPATVKELVEALIFAAEEPLTLQQIKTLFGESAQEGERRDIEESEVEAVLALLNDEFLQSNKPYRIVKIAGGYQFATTEEYATWIGKLHREQGRRKLSQSSLETLAIIAYRQPVTRPDIESIRGVDCDYVLGTLLEKKLITVVGRAQTPGRPLLYGTTQYFLKHFGLNEITDLPRPREIAELLSDARYETERRMLEAQEQADKSKKEEEDFKSRLPHIPKKKAEMDDSAAIVPRKQSRSLSVKKKNEDPESTALEQRESTGTEQVISSHATSQDVDQQPAASVEPASGIGRVADDATANDQPAIDVPLNLSPVNLSLEVEEATPAIGVHSEVPQQDVLGEKEEGLQEPEYEPLVEPVVEDGDVIVAELQMTEPDHVPALQVTEIGEETDGTEVDEEQRAIHQQEEELIPVDPQREALPEEPVLPETLMEEERPELIGEVEKLETLSLDTDPSVETPQSAPTTGEVPSPQLPEIILPPVGAADATHEAAPPSFAPIDDEAREPTKSRWQQLKETIQGFFKKVFG
ncbi:MAG: SMC-Scp complex subunit ScpB [Bacteroidota bacterium]